MEILVKEAQGWKHIYTQPEMQVPKKNFAGGTLVSTISWISIVSQFPLFTKLQKS